MKTQSHHLSRIIVLAITTLLLFSALPAHAAPARVAILPFDVHAEKDMTFLQEGILDMLGSRLAWRDKVDVINKNQTREALASTEGFDGESRALLVGGKLQADYVLFGSLTVFGESVSIDARMVDVSGQQAPVPFFAQTRGMGEVIPQINQFATTINESVFGRAAASRPIAAPAPPVGVSQATPAQPAPQVYDPRMHPEKLLQSGIQSENPVQVAGQPYQTPNPAFVASAPAYGSGNADSFWKSQRFNAVITGIDIGDVDKDGRLETVIVAYDAIFIYRNENGRMARVAELEKIKTNQYLGVDIADINGNGVAEIFVSSVNSTKDRFNSFVLEYDGSGYQRIAKDIPWHFRVVKPGIEPDYLVGQKAPSTNASLIAQPIFRMNWDGSAYTPGNSFLRGGKANVLGVAAGPILDNTQNTVAAYSSGDRLLVFRAGGEIEYKGDEAQGGNLSYFQFPGKEGPNKGTDNLYFPMRLRAADLNRDGKAELIVAANHEIAGRLMQNQRSYSNSRLISFSWNGIGMSENWKTNQIAGRISDYAIGDFDNDGADEMVAAVVRKEGRISFTDAESIVVAYELSTP